MTLEESKVTWEEHATLILHNFAAKLRNVSSEPEIMDISREMDKYEFNFNRRKDGIQ